MELSIISGVIFALAYFGSHAVYRKIRYRYLKRLRSGDIRRKPSHSFRAERPVKVLDYIHVTGRA